MSKIQKQRGLVIGIGSIGERHLHNLKSIGLKSISIFDQNSKLTQRLSKTYNVQPVTDLESSLKNNFDFAVICTPPPTHLKLAKQCLKFSTHVFLEKPIFHEVKDAKKFLRSADSKIKVGVGYNFRFNEGLKFVKSFLKQKKPPIAVSSTFGNHIKNWRPGLDYKNHYILKKGGGIILDGSHEYDFVRWLLDDKVVSVFCHNGNTPKLTNQTESIAAVTLKFKKGTIANFMLDFIRPLYQRTTDIISDKYEIKWDFTTSSKSWKKYQAISQTDLIFFHNGRTEKKRINQPINQMYRLEMEQFLASIVKRTKPMTDGWDAFETLQIGLAAIKSATKNKVVKL